MLRSFVRTLVGEDDEPEMPTNAGSFVDVGKRCNSHENKNSDSESDSESDASKHVTQ